MDHRVIGERSDAVLRTAMPGGDHYDELTFPPGLGVADDPRDGGKAPAQSALDAVDQIVHRAIIDVAEEGTEAAAATGVSVAVRAVRPASP